MKKLSQCKLTLLLLTLIALMLVGVVGCTPVEEPGLPTDGPEPDPTTSEPKPDPEPSTDPGTSDPYPYLILVNADNPLPVELEPELKTVQGNFKLEKTAADALLAMMADAKKEGIDLLVVSAYRPYETQERLYNNKVQEFIQKGYSEEDAAIEAAARVARPGTSEHSTGLAADIVTPSYQRLDRGFAETEAAKWMAANAHKYGFILRYPDDKQEITGIIFEPWHFRYVGVEHATIMTELNLCLEEYLAH
ncbi:MAG: D-alanyl-D-alanine carboxypeptidase family protein [Firmicutes bacterium]|nr:D-alanyl-D-alanine carboxypeptidase family protein [Bacillota bacterium]